MASAPEFHPAAGREFLAAVEWYADRGTDRANAFIDRIEAAIRRVREYPDSGPGFADGSRRVQVERFPYSLVYRSLGDRVQIVAIAHATSRRPGYWRDRLD